MNTWKVILATLVIFGTGVVTGGLLVNYAARSWQQPQRRPALAENPRGAPGNQNPGFAPNRLPAPMPGPLRKDLLDRLNQELNLSPAQRERIEHIITDGQDQTRQAWQQIEPQIRRELMETRRRIRAELTPEQQARFEEVMRQRPRDQRRPLPAREQPAVESARPN